MTRITNYELDKAASTIEGCLVLLDVWVREQPAIYQDMESLRIYDSVYKHLKELHEHITNQI